MNDEHGEREYKMCAAFDKAKADHVLREQENIKKIKALTERNELLVEENADLWKLIADNVTRDVLLARADGRVLVRVKFAGTEKCYKISKSDTHPTRTAREKFIKEHGGHLGDVRAEVVRL